MTAQPHQDPGQFAREFVTRLTQTYPQILADPQNPQRALIKKTANEFASFDFTPVIMQAEAVSARQFFNGVTSIQELLDAYRTARESAVFEQDIDAAMEHVHPYANYFLDRLFATAKQHYTDQDAVLIADWVAELDCYVAVKAVESLLNSKADLKLLSIAAANHWQVHFDHLAIRCGTQKYRDAERVVEMLVHEHHYTAPQLADEAYYRFSDGWNAYVLFKMLKNGQVLRLFIDQSDADDKQQIIQHWNRVYGYTAHHLAIRATTLENGVRTAVPLTYLIDRLAESGIESLAPTGLYTCGLLEQVFTRPEKNTEIPAELKNEIASYSPTLNKVIENGKLLEVVSRSEIDETLKPAWFRLHGLDYDPRNPLHSAPLYPYFLPAQAAHVIHTSVQTQ